MDDIRDRYRRFSDDEPARRRAEPVYRPRPLNTESTAPSVAQPAPSAPPKPIQRIAPLSPAAARPQPVADSIADDDNVGPQQISLSDAPPVTKMRKRSKKPWFIVVIIFVLLLVVAGAAWYRKKQAAPRSQQAKSAVAETQSADTEPQLTGTIRLVATGEMMAHDSVNQNAKQADGSYDYTGYFTNLSPILNKADIRVCTQGTPSGGAAFGITGHPTFNAPTEFARGIESAGCNVINLAAFHMNDKGQDAINATVAAWDNREDVLAVSGANRSAEEQQKVRYFTVKGVKFAFVSYTTASNNKAVSSYGVSTYSDSVAKAQVTDARAKADFVIVGMYWGDDGSVAITAEQEAIAQTLAAAGTDVVLGQGSHVVQSPKVLDGVNQHQTLVWYGLGNSLNTQLPAETLVGGIAIMDIDAATRKITNPKFLPTFMAYEWTAIQKRAQTLTARTNLKLYALDQAADPLARSQLGTTVEAQTARVTDLMKQFIPVQVITSAQY